LTRPRVEDDRLDSEVAEPLVLALGAELVARYGFPDPDPDGLTADDLASPSGAFVVAWLGDRGVGCGGVRRYDTRVGELKRMFVEPPFRGRGLSRLMLTALEDRARALGYGRLILETGVLQPEAIGLYETSGYTSIDPYGFYRTSPLSRCYAKALRPAGASGSGVSSGRRAPGGSSDPGTPSPR
jgi:GNAT superfamily N-acetyltransferase